MCPVGLRIDVDTLRGTRIGVLHLIDLLAKYHIHASFFFSVGPDNMGRHLWRLLRPAFLIKMLRTRASRLYGWDILLQGTLWPGPVIGRRCAGPIRKAASAGHEIGLHAWDHHRWQMKIDAMDRHAIAAEIRKAFDLLEEILGKPPQSFAAPAWRVTPQALDVLNTFPFAYESDCRGHSIFRPLISGKYYGHVQVPTTMPTYDELIGVHCTPETYNDYILDKIAPGSLHVLTIHAEVEGISCLNLFEDFLIQAARRGISFHPLGELVRCDDRAVPLSAIDQSRVTGREGWISCQAPTSTPSTD
ncbi:4-deoxy-4-formamido-L-arabinose-phosphoundecaprenol deformylase [Desulfatirhabdium butyrativorans]|uniref:4-deoxy-4-formamido-L-arabinose- phosphoundecaprenol deformylase n=1 Tax=Desulfatirhabdium butyrativorans TaxID=340467 RepID=UPI000419C981|nr:4-deoxy-4-formamido-L-arabinose-phosphoundecaprenol deformylase [Desulfatirhabdium butyrativorans]